MYRAGKHNDLCMMSTTFSQLYSWMPAPAIFILQGIGRQNLALGAVAVAETGTKLQCHKSEIMSHSLLLNAAFVSPFAFLQAYGHAAVVIIIFLVRGGLESCLSTGNYTGKVWDLWPILIIISFVRMATYKNHINIGGSCLLEPRDSLLFLCLCCFLAQGAKGRILACPTLVSDQGLRKVCPLAVTELHFGAWTLPGSSWISPAHHPQQAKNPPPHNSHLVKTKPKLFHLRCPSLTCNLTSSTHTYQV